MKHFNSEKFLYFLTGFILLIPATLLAQRQKPLEVRAVYDTAAIPELFNTLAIGFTFTWPDGHKAFTRGLLNGRVRWKDITIRSPQGKVDRGQLTFNPEKVWRNDHKLTFQVDIADTSLHCTLALPYVQQIQFNLYTDSLKRDVPFYLNVEGHFSNGRVYPLDAKKVGFRASGGALKNNVLLVKKADTAIHRVQVVTWLKANPDLRDSTLVPVKIVPDTASLPTEKELFRQWKKH